MRPGPGIWNLGNLGSKTPSQKKINKIKIRVAQNVGQIWISRKKSSWPCFMQFQAFFCVGRKKRKKQLKSLPIFLGGPMGPIHPVWGHVLVLLSIENMELGQDRENPISASPVWGRINHTPPIDSERTTWESRILVKT